MRILLPSDIILICAALVACNLVFMPQPSYGQGLQRYDLRTGMQSLTAPRPKAAEPSKLTDMRSGVAEVPQAPQQKRSKVIARIWDKYKKIAALEGKADVKATKKPAKPSVKAVPKVQIRKRPQHTQSSQVFTPQSAIARYQQAQKQRQQLRSLSFQRPNLTDTESQ